MMLTIPVVVGLAALVVTAALLLRVAVVIRTGDRAVMARHLQAMQVRRH